MAQPSSATLDYNSIRAEFGMGSPNVSLSLFNRTGTYVYNVPANANIPTSTTAQISVSNFYGARGKTTYAAGPGGTHSTGGKLPDNYYGTGGPSLPAMSDTGVITGDGPRTINAVYTFNDAVPSGWYYYILSGGPGSHTSPMNCYTNHDGAQVATWNMSDGNWSGPSSSVTWVRNTTTALTQLNTATLNIYKFF